MRPTLFTRDQSRKIGLYPNAKTSAGPPKRARCPWRGRVNPKGKFARSPRRPTVISAARIRDPTARMYPTSSFPRRRGDWRRRRISLLKARNRNTAVSLFQSQRNKATAHAVLHLPVIRCWLEGFWQLEMIGGGRRSAALTDGHPTARADSLNRPRLRDRSPRLPPPYAVAELVPQNFL